MSGQPADGVGAGDAGGSAADGPALRVVRGTAAPEEVAALVALLAARSGAGAPPPARPRSAWADPARQVRRPLQPGSGAWRASALPR